MKSKIPALLKELKEDLYLAGVEGLVPSVEAIERAYDEEHAPKPKKVATKKPATKGLTLVITNAHAHGESEIHFDTEAKAEAWMKAFRKNKDKQVEAYMKAKGLSFPIEGLGQGWAERYRNDLAQHAKRIKAAGLDTQILIKR
jgi:hypothetical protein